ncbi:S8 family serine peptidase [Angustibacter sp. Root456]|uniref:S8 family serine peptidase n=1 Tax=Angustibacter sp. Root456 TaxID=1736539 RepID=UPI00138F99A8|nr:S8 family serine peptidase [Angustibacter sp. Root456]
MALPIVSGVVAEVPRAFVAPAGLLVTADRPARFTSASGGDDGPTSTVRQTLGLDTTGQEGAGVTVALVDTGVADVPDLAGRLEHVDLTGTGVGDGYGHGTFLAGLLAGSGAASGGRYQGVAPAARVLDVKVAAADGTTSLSLVLRGLQEVAKRSRTEPIKVVNLSLASGSPLPYQVDPLDQALRVLWHQGITVVVAAGNDGPQPGTIDAPGNDPTLITVGGVDENGTAAHADDSIASWSGRGPTSQGLAKPDLAAPGAHLVGLRSEGSVIDAAHPQSRVGDRYFRGSGTSMAAAVASGAVANLLSRRTNLTPAQVKGLLISTAYQAAALTAERGAGAGGLDLAGALAERGLGSAAGSQRPSTSPAPGDPKLWAAVSAAFARGDRDAAAAAWDDLSPAARSWAARSWANLDPVARSWAARSWAARSWAGADAQSSEWAARSWAARSWAGEDWTARSWAARSWAGDDWAARSWAGDDWAARSWAADDWAARSWAATWR